MADERYEWLDKDTAERLLRGEPVGPVGDHARAQAERLSAALDGVARAGCHEAGELPGEAAALAAFRKARAAAPDTFSASVSVSAVRLGRKVSVPVRWARPVRLGLAGALAGVALGGVAVAAGTGVLPGPFGRGADPAPASSVSAAATPQPLTSGTATGEPGATGEPKPGATGTPGGDVETSGDGAGEGETGGTHESSPGSDTGLLPTYPGWTGDDSPGTAPGDGSGTGSGDWYRKTGKACQDYRAGTLTPDRERRLEAAANGADRVDRFCDRVLDGSAKGNGTGGKQGGGEGEGSSSGGGNGDGDGRGNGGDEGGDKGDGSDGTQDDAPGGSRHAVPPISYTLPPSPTVEPSATVGASPQPHSLH
ncbi:hypothetical protein J7E96_02715 [Streptomyces sp. ISL-96]|uniref:hypothetical protein n=1 Tax=Streptomyces sp. ISL-96 TaxID=2819191 RepID=UPI001BECA557|nr:hypothetical protein [Streptomyces sp. ISL-96]MBT2487469.1 hypothetical protein [Streptomyces sp. ISL-96]